MNDNPEVVHSGCLYLLKCIDILFVEFEW